jgi:hypothetical protein
VTLGASSPNCTVTLSVESCGTRSAPRWPARRELRGAQAAALVLALTRVLDCRGLGQRMGLLLFAAGPASAGHHGNMWLGQALKVESQLRVLDLASRPPTKSPREPRTPGALDGPGRFSLHDEAELRRMRKRFLEEQAAAGEDAARNAPKMDLRSEHLSRERLRRDCRQILDAWEVVDKEGRVHYDGFFQAVDRLVDYALVSEDLERLSTEEKEVLCDRIWVSISDSKDEEVAGPEGRPGIHSPIPVSTFLDAVIHVLYGESVMVDESEPKEIGKVKQADTNHSEFKCFTDLVNNLLMVRRQLWGCSKNLSKYLPGQSCPHTLPMPPCSRQKIWGKGFKT